MYRVKFVKFVKLVKIVKFGARAVMTASTCRDFAKALAVCCPAHLPRQALICYNQHLAHLFKSG
jgi:hypothetical protein